MSESNTRAEIVKTVARTTRADLYEEAEAHENSSATMQAYYKVIIDKHERLMDCAITAYEAALEAAGMAVVPREPTEAMLDNGGSSIIRPSIYMGGTPPGAKRRARDVWSAMLAAALPTRSE